MQNQIIFSETKLKIYFWTFICGFQGPQAPLPSIALRQFFYQSLPRLIPIVFTRWHSLLFGTKPYFHPLVLCVFTVPTTVSQVTVCYLQRNLISDHFTKKGWRPCRNDQKLFHDVYTNKTMQERYKIKLDHNSTIFFNIYGAAEEVEFRCDENRSLR